MYKTICAIDSFNLHSTCKIPAIKKLSRQKGPGRLAGGEFSKATSLRYRRIAGSRAVSGPFLPLVSQPLNPEPEGKIVSTLNSPKEKQL